MIWIKALHVIAVIAWMAGILYLYRLFVYHVEETEPVVRARLEKWEQLLLNRIMHPAMAVAVGAGVIQLIGNWAYFSHQPWMHAKLSLVVLLLGAHHAAARIRKRLVVEPHAYKGKTLRLLNEVPTLLMMGIVILVIVKPWVRGLG